MVMKFAKNCLKGLTIATMILSSCSNPLETGTDMTNVQLHTVKNGSILEPNTPIPLTLIYEEATGNFDSVTITLFNNEGEELASDILSKNAAGNNKKTEIDLPTNLENGIYHINYTLLNKEKIVYSQITDFFIHDGVFKIDTIQSYPPDPALGEKVILVADYTSPAGSDPFFRWVIKDKTVKEELASEGGSKYNWKTVAVEGAYPITVELFPSAPSDSAFGKFSSALMRQYVIFVSKSNKIRTGEFYPASSYQTLFHFRGEIADEGYLASTLDQNTYIIKGNPVPDFGKGIYGYLFNPNDFMEIPKIVIPFSSQGEMASFSIKYRFLPDIHNVLKNVTDNADADVTEASPIPPNVFFSAISSDNSFVLQLGNSAVGEYFYTFNNESGKFTYSGDGQNRIINLTVSFYSDVINKKCTIVWMINGKTVEKKEINFIPVLRKTAGVTAIGSGFCPYLIDEVGIYTKNEEGNPAVSSSCFTDYNLEKFGSSLLFSEGFDYSSRENSFEKEEIEIKDGQVVIHSGEEILAVEKVSLSGSMEFVVEGNCSIEVRNMEGKTVYASPSVLTSPDQKNTFSVNLESGNYNIYLVNSGEQPINIVASLLAIKTASETIENRVFKLETTQ